MLFDSSWPRLTSSCFNAIKCTKKDYIQRMKAITRSLRTPPTIGKELSIFSFVHIHIYFFVCSAAKKSATEMSEIYLIWQGGSCVARFMWKLTCSCGPVHFSDSVWLWRRWRSNKQWWQCKASKSQKSWEISWVSGHFSCREKYRILTQ